MSDPRRSLDSPDLQTSRGKAVGHVILAIGVLATVIGLIVLGPHGLF